MDNRLLTDEEIEKVIGEDLRHCYSGHVKEYKEIARAQLAKCKLSEPLIRADERAKVEAEFHPDYVDFKSGVEAGKELERAKILKFIEKECPFVTAWTFWGALKKGEMS